jgi:hypothetical protein
MNENWKNLLEMVLYSMIGTSISYLASRQRVKGGDVIVGSLRRYLRVVGFIIAVGTGIIALEYLYDILH